MMRLPIASAGLAVLVSLGGCVTPGRSRAILVPARILPAPMEITVVSTHDNVEDLLNHELRRAGFRIKVWPVNASLSQATNGATATREVAPTRYVLRAEWGVEAVCPHPVDGYDFSYFRTDLIDTVREEVVLSTRGSGTEGCSSNGHVVRDAVNSLVSHWAVSKPVAPSSAPAKNSQSL